MDSTPAISIQKLTRKKFKIMQFENEYKDLIGQPACGGGWMIYGDSGNGKTTFSLKLLKYLCSFKKCAYVPLEEGTQATFQSAVKRANLLPVAKRIKIWEDYTWQQIDVELEKKRSPDVVFIDSIQYLRGSTDSYQGLTRFECKRVIKKHPKKLFIFISHAKDGYVKGALADSVYFDSHVCIQIKNFQAIPKKSRYGGSITVDIKNL